MSLENILGPEYDFASAIPGPASMGVSSRGKLSQIIKNAGAVSGYIDMISSGVPTKITQNLNKQAFKQVRPLGARFFLPTIKKCEYTDENGNISIEQVSDYINTVPTGNSLGETVKRNLNAVGSDIQGLAPGLIEDVQALNPLTLLSAVSNTNTPTCTLVGAPVNRTKKDGSLVSENVFHPKLPYTDDGEINWSETTKKCMNKEYKKNRGVKCQAAFVITKQEQPEPRPPRPPNTANSINPSNFSSIEPFTNIQKYSHTQKNIYISIYVFVILFLLSVLIIKFL